MLQRFYVQRLLSYENLWPGYDLCYLYCVIVFVLSSNQFVYGDNTTVSPCLLCNSTATSLRNPSTTKSTINCQPGYQLSNGTCIRCLCNATKSVKTPRNCNCSEVQKAQSVLCQAGDFLSNSTQQCEKCDCNIHTSLNGSCNNRTGQCLCQDSVTGQQCRNCAANYTANYSSSGELLNCFEQCPEGFKMEQNGCIKVNKSISLSSSTVISKTNGIRMSTSSMVHASVSNTLVLVDLSTEVLSSSKTPSTYHVTPTLFAAASSSLIETPSSLAETPSSLAVTPSSLAVTPSSLAATPSSLAATPSSLAATPSSLAATPSLEATPSSLAATSSFLAATLSSSPPTSLSPSSSSLPPLSPFSSSSSPSLSSTPPSSSPSPSPTTAKPVSTNAPPITTNTPTTDQRPTTGQGSSSNPSTNTGKPSSTKPTTEIHHTKMASEDRSSDTVVIVLTCLGVVVILGIVIAIGCYCLRAKRKPSTPFWTVELSNTRNTEESDFALLDPVTDEPHKKVNDTSEADASITEHSRYYAYI